MRFSRTDIPHTAILPHCFIRDLVVAVSIAVVCLCANAANVNGRIAGVVTDPQDAVVPGVQITVTNIATGVKYTTVSGRDGGYLLPELPIGSYSIGASSQGFQTFAAAGIVLKIDQEYVEPIHLRIGSASEVAEVTASPVQVDTTDMQFSNDVDSRQMTELPLIGRSFAQLELTLPGVQAPSGSERVGGSSVSGAQQQQSEYLINGADTNDFALNNLALNPVLDAISEFTMIDGPLNAEYDRNSGGIVSAAIKSGTSSYHGDVFEFYRDTFLNTNNFFQKSISGTPTPVSPYHQNIWGGTLGGPILKNKLFFFGAFQATPASAPENPASAPQGGGSATVYTSANLSGNFTQDIAGAGPSGVRFSTNYIPSTISIPGCVSYSASGPGDTWASCLGTKLGGMVPTTAFNSVALALVKKYVPAPNSGTNGYLYNETTVSTDYQEDGRIDFNPTAKNRISFVGLYRHYNATNTLPFYGASLPGFGDAEVERAQQYTLEYTHEFGPTAVNDFGLHWTRLNVKSGSPQQAVAPLSAGFQIHPQDPSGETLPQLAVSGFFALGGTINGPTPRVDEVYQIEDNFTKSLGAHSIKFGYDGRRFTLASIFDANNSGYYTFNNTSSSYGTGDPSLDLLLGIPASYTQGTGDAIQTDAFLNYLYVQDAWRATHTLTVNYGLGYSIDTPLRNHQFGGLGVACFIPGEQSKVFPGSPLDLVYPGDNGCNISGSAVTHYHEFGPRIGFAWAPDLGAISGGVGKLSIRGGFGIYYNRTEEEASLDTLGTPPFGFTSGGATDFGGSPSLVNPFADINGGLATGASGSAGPATEANRFPYAEPATGSNVSFAKVEPIFNISGFTSNYREPYAENYQLSIEREMPSKIVARVSYVGSLGRHNQIPHEANYETAAGHAACLASPTCIFYQNYQGYFFPQNKLTGSAALVEMNLATTEGASNYNGLQVSVTKGETHGLLFQLSYTYSHAIDNGSSLESSAGYYFGGRGFNQYQPSLNLGDSTYDVRQRLVFSPVYTVPKFAGSIYSPVNMALAGWQISGIVTAATGFPYDISYGGTASYSLWCDAFLSFFACPDAPNQIAPLSRQNPRVRNGVSGYGNYFAASGFTPETVGSFGNIRRNPFHGPGINNTDLVLAKTFFFHGDGGRYIQLRMESYNVFNHTQFNNPVSQYGLADFGQINAAAAARQTQLAAKVIF